MARQRKLSAEPELQRVEVQEAAPGLIHESMYIGPTIPGVVHQNAIYLFGKEQLGESEAALTAALAGYDEKGRTDAVTAFVALQMSVEKYPEIADLIVPADGIMEGLSDINKRGTDLFKAKRRLVKAAARK